MWYSPGGKIRSSARSLPAGSTSFSTSRTSRRPSSSNVNIARALRNLAAHPEAKQVFDIPAQAIITLERLLTGLIEVGRAPAIAQGDLAEALYCKTSPLHPLLC